jgi:hypothetical protein
LGGGCVFGVVVGSVVVVVVVVVVGARGGWKWGVEVFLIQVIVQVRGGS